MKFRVKQKSAISWALADLSPNILRRNWDESLYLAHSAGFAGVGNRRHRQNQEAALNNVLVNGVEIRPQRLFEPVERGLWVLDLEPSSFPFPSTFPIN